MCIIFKLSRNNCNYVYAQIYGIFLSFPKINLIKVMLILIKIINFV
jgi:hypothetical protein